MVSRSKKMECGRRILVVPVLMAMLLSLVFLPSRTLAAEAAKDNQWNFLVLVYKNIDAPNYKKSFTNEEVEEIRTVTAKLPDTLLGLSGGRMKVSSLDFKVVETPVKSISDDGGKALAFGPGKDVNFEGHLKGHDYQEILIYAPLSELQGGGITQFGGVYGYNGQNIYYGTRNEVLAWEGYAERVDIGGVEYDPHTSACVCVTYWALIENSRANGWSGFQAGGPENGYDSVSLGWLDFYSDFMRDTLKSGKPGLRPESFLVSHVK